MLQGPKQSARVQWANALEGALEAGRSYSDPVSRANTPELTCSLSPLQVG